ncbi:MAG: glycosyltransferase family 39 protein, partial [Planctomycetes bacterium]|nr:glycosyltransferase family 39 protein [Planctomycetota bacterium]
MSSRSSWTAAGRRAGTESTLPTVMGDESASTDPIVASAARRGRVVSSLPTLLVMGGAALCFLWHSGGRGYEVQDVTRYSQMVVEMEHHHTWVPTLNGHAYFEAMPLAAWAPLGVYRITGRLTPATSRLATGLATVATVGLTILLGAWVSRRIGLVAGGLFVLTPLVLVLGRGSRVEAVLAFAVTAALVAFFRGLSERGWRLVGWAALSGSMIALAFAAKGPYAVALVGSVVAAYCVLERRWRLLAFWSVVSGAVTVVLTAAWLVPYLRALGPAESTEFLDQLIGQETVSKFLDGYGKSRPLWFYGEVLLTNLAPWSLPALFACVAGLRAWRDNSAIVRFCIVWSGVLLLGLSLSNGKHARYLLPCVPPLSVLSALELDRWA